jgi:hypothetical protein
MRPASWPAQPARSARRRRPEALDFELRVEERLGVGGGGPGGADQVLGLEVEPMQRLVGLPWEAGSGREEEAAEEVAVEGGEEAEVPRTVEVQAAGGRGQRGGGCGHRHCTDG